MRIRTTLLSLAMLALACAEGGSGSGAATDFEPTGGIRVASGNGARFNATRVVGPKVQINQRSDGSWGGTFYGNSPVTPTPIDATFQGGEFVGANIRLTITREGGQTRDLRLGPGPDRPLRGGPDADPGLHELQRRHRPLGDLREAGRSG